MAMQIYVICRLGGPYSEKLWPRCGLGQHFQARSHSFSLYEPTLSRQITYLFFSCDKLAYTEVGLRNFVIELAGLTCRLRTS